VYTFAKKIILLHAWASERGAGGLAPWILKFSAKNGYFLSFEWERQISLLWTPGQILEKSPSAPPLEKIVPTLMATWRSLISLLCTNTKRKKCLSRERIQTFLPSSLDLLITLLKRTNSFCKDSFATPQKYWFIIDF